MKKRILAVLLVLAMAAALATSALAAGNDNGEYTVTVTGTEAYAYAYQVAEQVNVLRKSLGLSELVIDPVMMETAMQRAAECAVYYSHTRPNGGTCYTAFPDRYWTYMAENIAAGYTTPAAVMNGWTNSPGHYANMTSANVNAFGVGCFYINGTYYWAQCFTGGAYETSSARKSDRQATVTVPVTSVYFQPYAATSSTIELKIGESAKLPVANNNQGFYNYATTISGIPGATLSGGSDLVKLNADTLTITAVAAGSGTVKLRLPNGNTLSFTVKVASPFTDVPTNEYYAPAVNWAVANGITTGATATTFEPDEACTRAQIVTFLWRAFGEPAPRSATSPFNDVKDPGEYYYNAVLWAVEQGITTGTDPGVFSPDEACTREQIVTLLWRAFGEPAPTSNRSPFNDVTDPGEYYYSAVLWAVEQGITTGTDPGVFSPDEACTRAQIVTFLWRALA